MYTILEQRRISFPRIWQQSSRTRIAWHNSGKWGVEVLMLAVLDEVLDRYRRYLTELFYVRDPGLRSSFEEAIRSAELTRGPYLEATRNFVQAQTLRELLHALLPASARDEGFMASLDGDRPLYAHQVEAFRRAFGGLNTVVATGTGSGKTEAFLYPILVNLWRERSEGPPQPGVRALILYPMNALAHDQRRRLLDIANRLQATTSRFRFTFGQYIGATPESCNDLPQQCPPPEHGGELLCRRHMRAYPPDILITNYSMLEYLLLRPRDLPLFTDARAWRYLVIDEAHQYRGTQGLEIGMLIRRLIRRLERNGLGHPPCCVATSATLGDDAVAVAQFATRLFGQPFLPADVVRGAVAPMADFGSDMGTPDRYADVAPPLGASEAARKAAGAALMADARVGKLVALLRDGPMNVDDLAAHLFPELPARDARHRLGQLATCVTRALRPDGSPLLPLRYHLFLRALGNVHIVLDPYPRLQVDLREVDRPAGRAEPASASDAPAAFDFALCRGCGQHYLVGQVAGGYLGPPVFDRASEEYGADYFLPVGDIAERSAIGTAPQPDDVDESDEEGEALAAWADRWLLCPTCGAIARAEGGSSLPACSHDRVQALLRVKHAKDESRAKACLRCGDGRPNALRPPTHGEDGPQSVIATALLDCTPDGARKLLAFADGRQRAAYFAWYMDDTSRATLERSVLAAAFERLVQASDGDETHSLDSWVRHVLQDPRVGELSTVAHPDSSQRQRLGWEVVLREVLTQDRGVSLQDTGLVVGGVDDLASHPELAERLERLDWPAPFDRLRSDERQAVVATLLDMCVPRSAVDLSLVPNRLALRWEDLGLHGYPNELHLAGVALRGTAWDGPRTQRHRYLEKVAQALGGGGDDAPRTLLRRIWMALYGIPSGPLRFRDMSAALDLAWWRLRPGRRAFACNTCRRVYSRSVRGICPTYNCRGTLSQIGDSFTPSHYRRLYTEHQRRAIRVEEHTAQIADQRAIEVEKEFAEGTVQMLSSSTTFELGVDLGDLFLVLLRNVPPEPFNYVQRAGRAGRRGEHPGIVVTYCGLSPHDLFHFRDPMRMLTGASGQPTIPLGNAILVGRHLMAQVLGDFFAAHPERFRDVQHLLGDWQQPKLLEDLSRMFDERRDALIADARAVLATTDLTAGDVWQEHLLPLLGVGSEGRLRVALEELAGEYARTQRLLDQATQTRATDLFRWAADRLQAIETEGVVQMLSRLAVIPKYGFPVDVVSLDVLGERGRDPDVHLERDLAIAIGEFAPGGEVVANKKLYTSQAVKVIPGRQLERVRYAACSRHRRLVKVLDGFVADEERCCSEMRTMPDPYLVPKFGFSTGRQRPRPPRGVPTRPYTTRPYFADRPGARWQTGEAHTLALPGGQVRVFGIVQGRIVILSPGQGGRGFYLCARCGILQPGRASRGPRRPPKGQHWDPYGQPCDGAPGSFALGHELVTDILRMEFPFPEPPADPAFTASLAEALHLAASDLLGVPQRDVMGLVLEGDDIPARAIVLYDTAPGGGGLVTQLTDEARIASLLQHALRRVNGECGCLAEGSCYGCLRTYDNQYLHPHLSRGIVHAYLAHLLAGQALDVGGLALDHGHA
ncbi:MAG: DEAD/DEAH box helicase [Firmicutes bacterium]|nr:DEAD/DEAH box helicase [Bacillota bacterium]